MKKTIAVIADLGNFHVYEWHNDPFQSTPRLELINAYEATDARGKRANTLQIMEKRSAQHGNNPRVSATASDGEQHNMELEKRKRLIREMACRIADFLKEDEVERCFLAVPSEINHQLVESIAPDLRCKIEKNVARDLTRVGPVAIVDHFADRAVHSRS